MKGPARSVTAAAPRRRCAIYTRKSSEEGLEQDFNSLHAQREACEAYVRSQVGEGWGVLPALYDDGGFSGGNMDRPGLERLMADVDAGRVDIVVVYKVDRLTRSLADFAKIVERFDAAGVSFVSVTQAFNTTTSMGRLTLNVLLSFAQFEREVTGERIRDKIAASKAKGMWMGGNVPLGYDPKGRTLVINEAEAEQVGHIFRRYLELGSVNALRADLEAQGYRSKQRVTADGREIGGGVMGRGQLFYLLSNRLYVGDIVHKGTSYPGTHSAIVDADLFDQVQQRLAQNGGAERRRKTGLKPKPPTAPLAGLVFDDAGNAMTSVGARKGKGRVYRYYVSTAVQLGRRDQAGSLARFPGPALEELVQRRLQRLRLLSADRGVRDVVERIVVGRRVVAIHFAPEVEALEPALLDEGDEVIGDDGRRVLSIPATLKWRGGAKVAVGPAGTPAVETSTVDLALLKGLVRAEAWKARILAGAATLEGIVAEEQVNRAYAQRLIRVAFLSPLLKAAILNGKQPAQLTLNRLLQGAVPLAWADQASCWI